MITALFPMMAQAQQSSNSYAIYSWQNNGDFNAFLNCNVDSITYSKIDLNGKERRNVVIKEIWTPDSVYRIPLAAIDSITFRAPEPKYKEGVFHIGEFHYPYVTEATDSTVTFNASIPSDSLPCVGQVVISDVFDEKFEKGFAGRVIHIVNAGGTIFIECEEVTLEDVFLELVCVGKTVCYTDSVSPAGVPRKSIDKTGEIHCPLGELSLTYKGENENDHDYVSLTVSPSIDFDYTIRIGKEQENVFKVIAHGTLDGSFDIGHEYSHDLVDWDFYPKLGTIVIPTSVPLLNLKINVGAFLKIEGTASISAKLPFTLKTNIGYDSQNGGGVFDFKGSKFDLSDANLDMNINAELSYGLAMKFSTFFVSDKLDELKMELKAGPKMSGEVDLSTEFGQNFTWYDFKDSKFLVSPFTTTVTGGITLFGKEAELEYTFPHHEYECYIFPEFTAPVVIGENKDRIVTTEISRDLWVGVTPGLGLYDNADNLKYEKYSDKEYFMEEDWDGNIQMELKNYPAGRYFATPIFKFYNSTVKAAPSTIVTISDMSVRPDSLDFGTLLLNDSQTCEFTITGEYLTGPLTLAPSGATDMYTIYPTTIDVGGDTFTKKVSVTFHPKARGTHNAKIIISGGGADSTTVNLTGKCINPTITVNPTSLTYRNITVDKFASDTFNIQGTDLTGPISLALTGDTSVFTITPPIADIVSQVQTNNTATVTVTYKPTVAGHHQAGISISGGGALETQTVNLNGSAVEPLHSITVNPSWLSFDSVTVGKTYTQTFMVTGQNLNGSLSLTKSDPSGMFTKVEPTEITAEEAESGKEVTVTYRPTQSTELGNNHVAVITVKGGGAEKKDVDVFGTAVNRTITVNPTTYDFGEVINNDTSSKTFTVGGTNLTGRLTLTLNDDSGMYSIDSTSISAGNSFKVTYHPTDRGTHSASVTISGGDASNSPTISLIGEGINRSIINVNPSSLSFDNMTVGGTYTQTFTVTGSFLRSSLSLTMSDPSGMYRIEPTLITAEEAESGKEVTVTYHPTQFTELGNNHVAVITVSGGGAEDKNVNVFGSAVNPILTVSPEEWNYGEVVKDNTSTRVFEVNTNITETLTLEKLGNNPEMFQIEQNSVTGSGTLKVKYAPTVEGNHSAKVMVKGSGIQKAVYVSGTCVVRTLTVPSSVSMTSLNGETAQTLINVHGEHLSGNLTVKLTDGTGYFNLSQTSIIPSGSNVDETLILTYTPQYAGTHEASITISGGGVDTQTIYITGTYVAKITVKPYKHSFGTVIKDGQTSKEFTVTSNISGSLSVKKSGSNASMFRISTGSVTAGGKFTVYYEPTAAGDHSATINVSSGETSQTVDVTGTCIDPTTEVSSGSLSFENLVVDTPQEKSFTVSGSELTGSLTLSLTQSETHGHFTITPTKITAAEAAQGKTVTVTCTAAEAGSFSGKVTISGGGAEAKEVSLSGDCPATISVSPTTWNFGSVKINKQSDSKSFTVKTNVNGSLSLKKSGNTSMFEVDKTSVSNNGSFNVIYKPTVIGSHSMTITIKDGNGTQRTVTVKGKCIDPQITVNPTTLSFGNVVKNKPETRTFTVKGTDLTGGLTVSPANSSYFTVDKTSITKTEATNGITLTVTYNPKAKGSHSATFTISGGDANSKTVTVTGTCIDPQITVNPSNLSFGNVVKDEFETRTFTVKGTDLTGGLTVSPANSSYFTVNKTSITKTEATNGVTVTVTYNPKAKGSHSATFTISGGDANSKTVTVDGTCVDRSITATPQQLTFTDVAVDDYVTKTFRVKGNYLKPNTSLTLTLNNPSGMYSITQTTIPAANATQGVDVTVQYHPTQSTELGNNHSASISISGGGVTEPTVVNVFGTAIKPPTITVSKEELTFIKTLSSQKFIVTGSDLKDDVTLSCTNDAFTITPTFIPKSEALNGKEVEVVFTGATSMTDVIEIKSTDATPRTVTLKANPK